MRRLLEQPDVLATLRTSDPLATARVRGLRAREDLLALEGGAVSAEEAARLLGISRQAVDNRRAGRVLALTLGRRDYRYPLWQFAEGGILPGLDEVLQDLGHVTPWMQAAFLLNGNDRLPGAQRGLLMSCAAAMFRAYERRLKPTVCIGQPDLMAIAGTATASRLPF